MLWASEDCRGQQRKGGVGCRRRYGVRWRGRWGTRRCPATLRGDEGHRHYRRWVAQTRTNDAHGVQAQATMWVNALLSHSTLPLPPSPFSPPFTLSVDDARAGSVAGIFGTDCRFKSMGKRVISRSTLIESFRLECMIPEREILSI